jgi:hypothetical protein
MVGCRLKYYESFKDCWAVDTAACEDWEAFVFFNSFSANAELKKLVAKMIIYLLPYA